MSDTRPRKANEEERERVISLPSRIREPARHALGTGGAAQCQNWLHIVPQRRIPHSLLTSPSSPRTRCGRPRSRTAPRCARSCRTRAAAPACPCRRTRSLAGPRAAARGWGGLPAPTHAPPRAHLTRLPSDTATEEEGRCEKHEITRRNASTITLEANPPSPFTPRFSHLSARAIEWLVVGDDLTGHQLASEAHGVHAGHCAHCTPGPVRLKPATRMPMTTKRYSDRYQLRTSACSIGNELVGTAVSSRDHLRCRLGSMASV